MGEISRKILCVDDEANFLASLRRQLRKRFDITTAPDGQSGLRVLAGPDRFAVVVADCKMPRMSGIDFLRQAHQISPESVPVMLTGCAEFDVAVAALHQGHIYRFLTKPCPPELLEATLNACLERYRSRANERILVDELRRANEELRTLNVELQSARAEALAAVEAKSNFLACMSHELRTPLNSVIGFTELMIHDSKDPPAKKRAERLDKVHRNARNLLALLNDLLDISKIEARRLTLSRECVDLDAVVRECVESTRPLVRADQVELQLDIEQNLPRWRGDPLRLRQIVTNLLGNAAKFTETGHISVRAANAADALLIEVEDTGIGISPRDLPRIFDQFEQVDSSSTRRASGTGLGLAICRQLCELMGGTIKAWSEPDHGSRFEVRLPWEVERRELEDSPSNDSTTVGAHL